MQQPSAHAPATHHVLPIPVYLKVFGALVALTVLTVAVSYAALQQPWSLIAAMVVAVVKAALVAGIFMHLRYDLRFHSVVLGLAVAFVALFFAFTFIDLTTRGTLVPEQDTHTYQDEQALQQHIANTSLPPVEVFPEPKP